LYPLVPLYHYIFMFTSALGMCEYQFNAVSMRNFYDAFILCQNGTS